jgi:hypothetical protein
MTRLAYACRDALYDCFPIAIWDDPADEEANGRWIREMRAAMAPFSAGRVYVNNRGNEDQERVKAPYKGKAGMAVPSTRTRLAERTPTFVLPLKGEEEQIGRLLTSNRVREA